MPATMAMARCTACGEVAKVKINEGDALPACHCGGAREPATEAHREEHLARAGVRRTNHDRAPRGPE